MLLHADSTAPPYLTPRQAAAYLKMSRRLLDLYAADGKVARVKFERKVLFRRIDLDAFVSAHLEPARREEGGAA